MNSNRYYLIIPLLFILAAGSTCAQNRYADTFYVTVADKTPEHPYYGQGSTRGYVVNGQQSPTITLVRDSIYLFDTHEVPEDFVFLFYSKPIGGTRDVYIDHIKEQYVSQGLWVIQATDETPDTLYYASEREPWGGGTILIVDSITTSVEEDADRRNRRIEFMLAEADAYPNPCAGETEVRFVLEARSTVHVQVVDALGEIVQTIEAGTMETGPATTRLQMEDLPPGVYLYRIDAFAEGKRSVATGKVQVVK